jgi:hypothetical protein
MNQEPNCQYREKRGKKEMNVCHLGLYGGRVTDSGCLTCIEKGQNNKEYKQQLFEKAKRSHPSGVARISGCCDSARNYID